jgi:tetratricopeptide (TPR) repeat protein
MAHDVFISYSNKDKPTADAVCAALEANGVRCWIAPRDILPGSDWGEAIIDAIHGCRAMLLIFSSNSNSSAQIKREVERSVNAGIPVVPFRIEDVMPSKTLEYFISTQHWLDALTPPVEQHLHYLVNTMRAILAQKPDGSEVLPREPQLKAPPAAAAVAPPEAPAAPVAAPAAPGMGTAPAPAPAPAPPSPGQKFARSGAIIILVVALAAAMVAAVLWQRRDRPAVPPVAVKAPEKPLAATKVPNPVEPEGKAQTALNFAKQSQAAPDFDQKIALIGKAIDLSTTAQDKAHFYEMRGEYYFQNRDYAKAVDDLTKALMLIRPFEQFPKYEIYEKRGLAYQEQGDLEKARQDFKDALRDDPLKSRTDKYQAYIDKINEQLPTTPAAPTTPTTPAAPVAPPVVAAPPVAPPPPAAPPSGPGVWPWTSERLVSESDLQGMSGRDLELMRNEIYARHGWVFRRPDLRQYFEGQPWYRPNRDGLANRIIEAGLSGVERRNVQIIQEQERRIRR